MDVPHVVTQQLVLLALPVITMTEFLYVQNVMINVLYVMAHLRRIVLFVPQSTSCIDIPAIQNQNVQERDLVTQVIH